MSRKNDASRSFWILRSDDVREPLHAVGCRIREGVLLDVPVEFLHRFDYVLSDHGVVIGVGCPWNEDFGEVRVDIMRVHIANGVG